MLFGDPRVRGLGGLLSTVAHSCNELQYDGRTLAGRLLDERALTDLFFNTIARSVPRARAIVDLRSRERTTGADALLVIRYASGTVRAYALQAKVMLGHKQAKPREPTPKPHYPALDHPDGRAPLQYDLLLEACGAGGVLAGWIPLHVFYNELTPGFPTKGWACTSVFPGDPGERGVTVARTEDVKVISDARLALAVGGGRPRFPVDLFAGVSRPWLCLLCDDRVNGCRRDRDDDRNGGTLNSDRDDDPGGGTPNSDPGPRPVEPLLPRDAEVRTDGHMLRQDFEPHPWPEPPVVGRAAGSPLAEGILRLIDEPDPERADLPVELRKVTRSVLAVDQGPSG